MSNGSNVRPKTMIFRPRSPVGAKAPVAPSQPPADTVSSAVPAADQPILAESTVSPVVDASPVDRETTQQEPDRPHSRKFTLTKSPDQRSIEPGPPAVAVPASGKGKFRFGEKSAATSEPLDQTTSQEPVQSAQVDGRPIQVKSFVGAYIRLSVWGLFVCMISFLVYWMASRGTTAGHFGAIIGRVEVVSGKYMKIAESQVRLHSGDVIKAQQGSTACVLLEGVDSVQIYGPSEVIVKVLKQQAKQPATKAIELSYGTIDLDVVLPVQDRLFTITTANAFLSFMAGRFLVVHTNNTTRLSVREGVITIAQRGGDKQSLQVEPGYEVIVEEGVPLVPKSLSGDTTVKDLFLLTVLDTPFEGVDSPLKSSVVVDRNKQVALLAVRAVTDPPDGVSVKFDMKGCPQVIVNEPPYVFRGPATAGSIGEGWNPERGDYTLVVTAYSRKDGKGKPSFPKSVLFKVKGVVEY